MVELAKVLRFSNLVRNVFGASPFFFDTEALKAKDIVRVTFLSTWPPLFLFVFCLIGLVLGSYLQYLSNISHGNPSAVVDNDVMGVQFVEGSITMIIMQMTILSTLYTYIMAIIVTRLKRKNWCRFMVSILELVDKLDTRYQQKFDSIAVRNRLTIVMSTLLLYHFLFFIIFQWFIVPGMDSYYLIPICYTIESITASMTAVDILNSMIILGNIFNMLGEIPVNRKDEEFFGDYASAMDLIEAVGQVIIRPCIRPAICSMSVLGCYFCFPRTMDIESSSALGMSSSACSAKPFSCSMALRQVGTSVGLACLSDWEASFPDYSNY